MYVCVCVCVYICVCVCVFMCVFACVLYAIESPIIPSMSPSPTTGSFGSGRVVYMRMNSNACCIIHTCNNKYYTAW